MMTPELKVACEAVFQEHKTNLEGISWKKDVFRGRISTGLSEKAKETLLFKNIIYYPNPNKKTITQLNPDVFKAKSFQEAEHLLMQPVEKAEVINHPMSKSAARSENREFLNPQSNLSVKKDFFEELPVQETRPARQKKVVTILPKKPEQPKKQEQRREPSIINEEALPKATVPAESSHELQQNEELSTDAKWFMGPIFIYVIWPLFAALVGGLLAYMIGAVYNYFIFPPSK